MSPTTLAACLLALTACTGPKADSTHPGQDPTERDSSPATTTPDSTDTTDTTTTDTTSETAEDSETTPTDTTEKTYPWTDPDDDYDGDGFTENQGDCEDRDGNAYPGALEDCYSGDTDCDGQDNENCQLMSIWYHGRVEFDANGLLGVWRVTEFRNEAMETFCTLTGRATEAMPAPDCPDCTWTFGAHQVGEVVAEGSRCAYLCMPDGDCSDSQWYMSWPLGWADAWEGDGWNEPGAWEPALLRYDNGVWMAGWGVPSEGTATDATGQLEVLDYSTWTTGRFSGVENYYNLYGGYYSYPPD